MQFISTFEESYLRNNRRGGQKNLRCFPTCSERGHRASGFCGCAVQCAVDNEKIQCTDCVVSGNDVVEEKVLISLAEFVTNGKEPTDITVGLTCPVTEFEADTRCKKNPLRRFVRGIKSENENVFSYKPSCWHYSWRSNKHATDTKHFLRVVTFEVNKDNSSMMTCVSLIDTPKFTLFSSKILDKTTSKRRIETPKTKKEKSLRPKKKLKRSNTEIQEPRSSMLMSNEPTEEMDAWSKMGTPSSPVSVTFFDDLFEQDDESCSCLSLEALVSQLENTASSSSSDRCPTPLILEPLDTTISDFTTTDESLLLDNSSMFKFDPFLDDFA